ncbi:3-methyl-2-oxobutanoate hydroxymethyltransferase [candidate division LCP-89 bacterium B3_LCP]|uniref:3-methyl-2-oxobutanoate hydroxymethyltransferase n=1 Tax=candidate division LCP-89 bacterium B3_LCP TaxID=2012998 RepID=A0A532UY19_UNCL8|nr:MAG: 3-methyl-2-oxobutanoate hydroxymethyltransferase [candidate division LCP-89 bacterium B3_LCP]
MKKITTASLLEMKKRAERIAVLTAYDATFAQLQDRAGIDVILVGDSAAMVMAGDSTTLSATMDQMLYHVSCVSKGIERALLVADMPFLSFQITPEETLENAGMFLAEASAEAVKLEGGKPVIETVKRLVDAGIPVMGHLGLTPQSIHKFGGWGVRAKGKVEAAQLYEDALALEEAGAFSIVLEKIPAQLAAKVSQALKIPTIGIGSGPDCDGQVLVNYDMLGLYEQMCLKFVRQYRKLGEEVRGAVKEFITDVKEGNFPSAEESYYTETKEDENIPHYPRP